MVMALIEADERRVQRFLSNLNEKRPSPAKVGSIGSITSGDHSGEIMPLWQTAAMDGYGQMNKAIFILQAIEDNTLLIPKSAKNTEKILKEVKGLRDGVQPGFRRTAQTNAGGYWSPEGSRWHAVTGPRD
jgi:hypothetical protein